MSTEWRSTSTTPPKRSTIRAPDFWPCGSDRRRRRRVVRPRAMPLGRFPPSLPLWSLRQEWRRVEWTFDRETVAFQPHQSSQVESAAMCHARTFYLDVLGDPKMFCSLYILLQSPLTQKFPVCQSAWSEIPVPLSRHRRLCRPPKSQLISLRHQTDDLSDTDGRGWTAPGCRE